MQALDAAAAGPSEPPSSATTVVDAASLDDRRFGKNVRRLAKKHEIVSTKCLVDAYIKTQDQFDRGVLFRWLALYDASFRKKQVSPEVEPGLALEYAELMHVPPRTPKDKELLKIMLMSLTDEVNAENATRRNVAKALNHVLHNINPATFSDASDLIKVANKLMECLASNQKITRDNFEQVGASLVALHHLFVLLHKTPENSVTEEDRRNLRQNFNSRLDCMNVKYYPVEFHLWLVKQSIERLTADAGSCISEMGACVVPVLWGLAYFWHGLAQIKALDIDPSAIEEGLKRIKVAIAQRQAPEQAWYDMYLVLRGAATSSLADAEKLVLFLDTWDTAMEWQEVTRNKKQRKALRFGMVCELRRVGEFGKTPRARADAARKLMDLAEIPREEGPWIREADILEAVLESLHAVYWRLDSSQADLKTKMEETVDKTVEIANAEGKKKTLRVWQNGLSAGERLKSSREGGQLQKEDELFHEVRKEAGLIQTVPEMRENIQNMKEHYKSDTFAKVESIFENEQRRHVRDFNYFTVVYEADDGSDEPRNESGEEDHTESHNKRANKAHKPISLGELFRPTPSKPNESARGVRSVLLYGNPGTGKTCISKTIAYKWASGTYEESFEAVYVLPVRQLNGKRDTGQCTEEQAAIAEACFPRNCGATSQGLWAQIDDDLDMRTTLLILDGLDEGDNVEDLLDPLKERPCHFLFLSRPYNLQEIRKEVDLQVECRGLNEVQLVRFIESEVPDTGDLLVEFLRNHPTIWETAQVPVTAMIICFLWKEEDEVEQHSSQNQENKIPSSLYKLYSKMVMYVWRRYVKKEKKENADRGKVFQILKSIAYESLNQGQILIKQSIVEQHANTDEEKSILKDCGFLLLQLEGKYYQFPHLTFQEFFAGQYLARGLKTSEAWARDFLKENKYKQRYKVTMSFMAEGVCCKGPDGEGVRGAEGARFGDILSIFDEGQLEITGIHHSLVKLRLIEASVSIEESSIHNREDPKVCKLINSIGQSIGEMTQADPRMRESVISHLIELPNLLRRFDSLVKPFANMLEKSPSDIELLRQIIQIIKYVPDQLGRLEQNLEERLTSEEEDVRASAMEQSATVISAAQQTTPRLLEVLKKGLGDETSESVRAAAVKQLASLATSSIQVRNQLATIVTEGIEDPNHFVRASVMELIPTVMELIATVMAAHPEETEKYIKYLERRTTDPHEYVRAAAINQVAQVLSQNPEGKEELLFFLLYEASQDRHQDVRAAALGQVARFVELKPEYDEDILQMIEKALRDSANVRAAALNQISLIISAVSESEERILAVLYSCLKDKDELVQHAARQQIETVVDLVPEDSAKRLRELAGPTSSDAHQVESTPAAEQLFPGTVPDSAEELKELSILLKKCVNGQDDRACNQAKRALQRMKLDELFKIYWAEPGTHVAKEIVYRLVDAAVTVAWAKEGELKLLSYAEFKLAVYCTKPKADIERLLSSIEDGLKKIFPEFFTIPIFEKHRSDRMKVMELISDQ